MNYHQMLPVVDEWVLWLLVLLTPLVGLWAVTAFIVLHRERKTVPREQHVKNLLKASLSGLGVLLILAFMLFSGLRIEANKANATENIKAKYNITSVRWDDQHGKDTNPTESTNDRIIMVTDQANNTIAVRYSADPKTSEPTLEATRDNREDQFIKVSPETLLKNK